MIIEKNRIRVALFCYCGECGHIDLIWSIFCSKCKVKRELCIGEYWNSTVSNRVCQVRYFDV